LQETFTQKIGGAPYLAGLIGTSPSFGNGALWASFVNYTTAKHGVTKLTVSTAMCACLPSFFC
jgi:hypothetical protein